jgi:isoleucyl-tRNA synthetase
MINFPIIEKKILKFWQKNKIFEKSLQKESPMGNFVFFEGPPTANGQPHLGHLLTRIYKDVVLRYKTMRGYHVERKAGWDTQGLPVELEVEREIGISGKPDIEKFGIAKFNQKCKKSVWKYKKEWEEMTKKIGFWIDLKNPYITYEKEYIETIFWIIEQIWHRGLLYQDYKVVPHCPRCGTTLSSHEVAQGYKNIEEDSIYLKFRILNSTLKKPEYLIVWTTTPWTLPANVALAINKFVKYIRILKDNEYFILAKDRLGVISRPYEIIDEFLGEKLLGLKYQPLFEFIQPNKPAYYVIHGDFVSVEEGTGIVHIAPAFGEEDLEVGKENNLPILITVELDGKISQKIQPFAGLWVKDADPLIIEDLKRRNILLKIEKISHDYPFCWRCDTPLLYYAKLSWFIKMTDPKIKQALIENNQKINWIPSHVREGRFGEWLAQIKDWAISRERYWGTPLPIWECEDCNYRECVGSFNELERRTGKKLPKNFDPHRPFIDKITWICPRCGGKMKRVLEVLDCWFDSGSMPFAQWHYPFENKDKIEKNISYPADFICEGIDQTRGWFYSLLAISTLLDKGNSYKNVICLGHVLDAKGQKMSKSKGNVISWRIVEEYGADPIRWYLYTLNQPAEAKPFDLNGVRKTIQNFFITLLNCFEFYKLYKSKRKSQESTVLNVLDRWILSKLNLLIKEVTSKMDNFEITEAARLIENFVQDLSLWYIRRSRERFKKFKESTETLEFVLYSLTKLLAPFIPFLTEELYQLFKKKNISVHLDNWPEAKGIDYEILKEMDLVRKICEEGHRLRALLKIKVRQPLKELKIKSSELKGKNDLLNLIKEELNVKEIIFDPQIKEEIELNPEITEELKEEGLCRELIRQINVLRKEAKLTYKDKVIIYYKTDSEEIKKIFQKYGSLIAKETIAKKIVEKKEIKEGFKKEVEIDGEKLILFYEG